MILASAIASLVQQTMLLIFSVLVLVPLLAAGSRRLNAIGRSGWWQLLFLVQFGFVPVFLMLAMPGRTVAADDLARGASTG